MPFIVSIGRSIILLILSIIHRSIKKYMNRYDMNIVVPKLITRKQVFILWASPLVFMETHSEYANDHENKTFLSVAYDILSFLETIIFSISGSYCLFDENNMRIMFSIAIICIHGLGICMKTFYYGFVHKWMDLPKNESKHFIITIIFYVTTLLYVVSILSYLFYARILPLEWLIILALILIMVSP